MASPWCPTPTSPRTANSSQLGRAQAHPNREGVFVTQALVSALSTPERRRAAGIAEAEAELVRARSRCRELRETLALARAREAAAVVTPVREPDDRERPQRVPLGA